MSIYKNDINVSLNIGANTQQAQQQIQALQASLNKLSSAGFGANATKSMREAATAAQQLQMHLQKAYNTKTGNLDLGLLNKSLTSANTDINKLSANLINAGQDGRAAFTNLAKSIASANQPMLKTNTLLGNMWTTLKNTARWQISSSVLQGFMGSIQKAYGYAQDLNKSLTDIRIVTGYSADKMKDFAVQANNAAKALSTTTNEYAKASLIYFQQGLNDQQVKERTDVTVKMANVTRDSAQTVSDQMTAIWNNFDDGSKSLEYYADVITALGAATASSTDEIAQGLEKFAAVASTVGLSYEYATSALATITAETRQSADVVGTALKTLFARIQGLSLGETLDDGTDLNKYSEALAKVGISIKDQNGGLKDMDTLLEEMAAKWDTLNKDQQVALAQTVAGVRQYTQLVALMDNWDAMQTNLKTAANSEGTLQEQADIYAESWEAAKKRAKAALEEIYSTLLDDTFFIKLTNTIADLTSGIGDFLKGIGGVKTVLLSLVGIFLTNFAHKIPAAIESTRYNLSVLFGGASDEAKRMTGKFNEMLTASLNSDKLTVAQKQQIEYSQRLLLAKSQLAKITSTLTDSERFQAESAIAQLEAQQQEVDELYNKVSQLRDTTTPHINEAAIGITDKSLFYNGSSLGIDNTVLGSLDSANIGMMEKLTNQVIEFGNAQLRLKEIPLKDIVADQMTAIEKLIAAVEKTPGEFDNSRRSIIAFANSMKDVIPDSVQGEFNQLLATINGATDLTTLKNAFKELYSLIDKSVIEGRNFNEVLEKLGIPPDIISKLDQIGIQERKAARGAEEIRNGFLLLQDTIKHTAVTLETVSKAAGGLTSIAMSINAIKSASETLRNPDVTGLEKFTSVIMSFGMALTMGISGLTTWGKLLSGLPAVIKASTAAQELSNAAKAVDESITTKQLLLNKKKELQDLVNNNLAKKGTDLEYFRLAARKLNIESVEKLNREQLKKAIADKINYKDSTKLTAQEALEAVGHKINEEAVEAETKAKLAAEKANKALRVSMLKLIGGLAILALAIALIVNHFKKMKEASPEYQLEKITEESEKAAEKANAAEEAYKSLKETIEGYDSAVKSLEDLTEGTEEFKAAVEEANEKARELIDTYNITKGVSIDKNGLIVIDENILKEKQSNYFDTSKATAGAEYVLKEGQKELTAEVDNRQLIDDFIKNNKIYGNSETAKEVYLDPEKLSKLIDALKDLEDGTTENDAAARELVAELFNQRQGTAEFSKNLDSLLSASSAKLISLADQLSLNTNALLSNTDALIFAANMLQGNETYENSEYKNTLALAYDEAYKDAFENSEIDTFSEAQEALGIGKVTSTGQTIEENGKTLKTYNYNGGVYTQAEIIDLAKSIEANTAAVTAVENKQSYLETLSPTAAQITEITNSGYASTGSYNKDLEIYNYAKSNNQYGTYENFLKNFNPYEDIENKIAEDFEGKDINGETLGEGDTANVIKNWWAGLSDEDKTVALNIEYDKGQWQEQLNALKAESVYTETAEQTGYSEEAVKSYTQMLMSQNEAYKNNEYLASIAAQQNLNFAKGQADAFDILNDYESILKKANKESIEYHEVLGKLNTALAQMFGAEFSYEFLTENLDTVKKALNGNEEAIQTLREEASKQILIDIGVDDKKAKKEISELYKLLDGKKIGDNLEKPFLDMFNNLIQALSLTKDQAESLLNSMGISATNWGEQNPIEPVMSLESVRKGKKWIQDEMGQLVEVPIEYAEENSMATETIETKDSASSSTTASGYMTLTPTEKDTGHTTVTYKVDSNITTTTEGESSMTLPKLEGAQIANTTSSISNGAKANKPADTGGGGGGSNAEPLEYEGEIERYHENTRAIERLSRALDKVSTAKDRAFGKHRLALIDDEIEATEALVQQQRLLLAETREYLKQDFAEIQQYGFTYDEFGELTNYDEVMKEQIDKYNAVVATGNADAIEAAKKEYEEFKENMEQYEETLTQYEEAQAQLQEYINQVVDLKLEKITTEVEIKILVNDKELTRLEYLLRKVEYEGKGAADAIALMGRQFEQISEKAKPIQEAIDKIYEQARAEGRGLLEEEVKEIKSFYQDGVISSEEEKRIKEIYDKAASEDRMLTQAEEEQIQEYKEQLLELNQEVMDIVDTIKGKFMETLEELNGKVDESIGRFATYTGMFQTLSDVITLSGKAGSKYGMDMLNTLSARTVANASTAMRSSIRGYEALDQIYQEAQANLERAIKDGDEYWINHYQDTLHQVEMMREASYESMLSSWSEALQAANDLFDTKLTNMVNALKQNIGDIDKLVEIYDRAVELEDLYISGNKSIYELSKLARDVGKDIDKTANIIAKNKLTGLLEQINKLRAEGVKLSQYDLEYWKAKYELEVAEIALQEAQEAKAQVKLTRNTAGGWGYTYVADAEAISEAQQNYEESLYNMQELHDGYIRDYSERLIKNRQDLVNALQDLDKTSLTFEEDALRLKEHHFKQEEYLIDELNKVYQRAGISYQDTLLAQTYGGASLEDSHSNFINSVAKMIQDELLPGYQEFQESVDGINSQAGTTVEDAMDKIFESSITMEDEVIKNINDLTSGVKEVSDEIWNFQETYGEAISKMLADNEEYYSKTIKMYQNFMAETEADKWLQYFDDMRGPGEVLGVAGSGATGAMAGNGSTAITNSAFGSILQQSTKGKSNSSSSKSYSNDDNDDELIAAAKEAAKKAGKDYYVYEKGGVATVAPLSPGGNLLTSDLYKKDGQTLQTVNDDRTLNLSKGPLTDAQKELREYNDGEGYVYDPKTQRFVKPDELATGGYTGSWGSEGRLAVLHEKELVLNKYDTENMLDMVNTLRDIDWRAKLSELWTNIEEHFIAPIFGGGDNLQQDVRIEASFPGVSNHTEIEEAFNNLINTASQYANRKRY